MKARGKFTGSVVLGGRRERHAPGHCEERLLVRHRRKCGYRSYPLWRAARPKIQKLKLITFRWQIYFEEKSLHFDVCRAFLWRGVGTIYHKVPISCPGSEEA